MSGIYIHIPFCKKACHYCNFHFSTSVSSRDEFTTALLKEIEITSPLTQAQDNGSEPYLVESTVSTIYFGGGTPSLLHEFELTQILDKIRSHFIIEEGAEVTLEANPDDITPDKLKAWKAAGINRLSIGVQSFYDDDLKWMNRAHDAYQAASAIAAARQEGFQNITIDLIYGTPLMTDERWQQTIDNALAMDVPHLSCYALTVEPYTALDKMIKQNKSKDTDPGKQANQFLVLSDRLQSAGYEHYEISSFAIPGMRSRHNSAYWQGKPYLGLGPSAHSFNTVSRQRNISNNSLYIQSLRNNIRPAEVEELTATQRLNEYVMISLRTMEGINLHYVETNFGEDSAIHIRKSASKYIANGKLTVDPAAYRLTREGKLFADGIAADLFK